MTSRTNAQQLPIACTLDAAEGGRRVDEWRRLADDFALARELHDGRLVVRYAPQADAAQRLAELVEAERRCCAFVDWRIESSGDELRLVVNGDDFALATLPV
jgi:cobalamin biosynthesis protein CobT